MPKPTRIDKTPFLCSDNSSLRAGDILIFNYNHHRSVRKGQWRTMCFQKILNEPGGHKDTVHAAMVVEINGELKIAHLRAEGFALDDINSIKTTTHVYRPTKYADELSIELNAIVSKMQKDQANGEQLHWSYIASIRAYLRRLANSLGTKNTVPIAKPVEHPENLPDSQISWDSICSKFVAQAFITACYRLSKNNASHIDYRREIMNIGSFTTPKTLQAYLYRNSNFEYMVMPSEREKLYPRLVEVIEVEIKRLKKYPTYSDKFKKGLDLEIALKSMSKIDDEVDVDDLDGFTDVPDDIFTQSICLLKKVVPILKRNTGNHVKTSTSYTNVMNYAKSQGIYTAYIKSDLVFGNHIQQLAKEKYKLTDPMANLYAAYRELGYTDEEAKFETNLHPGFVDWFNLNPLKNAVAVATVVPFLFFSLPYGAYRAISTGARNRQIDEAARAPSNG
ncbi:MAG: hypothetical protein EPN84_06395 [Legionella sp.]|nr:MAG: hypothetical protein EPN84_06395 [Legionella sp.]